MKYFIACAMLILSAALQGCSSPKDPNIIIIFVDDLGYADIEPFGRPEYDTPNFQRLAKGGVIFTNAYSTSPVCSPSRAGLLTGRQQEKFGYGDNINYRPDNPDIGLPIGIPTLGDMLTAQGYDTAAFGKWHLGSTEAHHPFQRGFSHFVGFLGGGHQYLQTHPFNEKNEYSAPIYRGWQKGGFEGYLTDYLTDQAVAYINQDRDKPFAMYLAYNAPHGPNTASERDIAKVSAIEDPERRTYASMVLSLDRAIGELMLALEQKGIADDTLIVFMNDNGGISPGSNAPFKGHKAQMFEGGIRVPMIFHWANGLPAGRTFDQPVWSLDIAATIAGITGIDAKAYGLDGQNLMPYLENSTDASPHEVLHWKATRWGMPDKFAVRKGDWKLLRDEVCEIRLYNLSVDQSETSDLSEQHPEIVADLLKEYALWNETNEPSRWRFAQKRDWKIINVTDPEYGCPS